MQELWVDFRRPIASHQAGRQRFGPRLEGCARQRQPDAVRCRILCQSGSVSVRDGLVTEGGKRGGIFLLLIVVAVTAIGYIGAHPVAGATREQRAAAMGTGLGTLFSFFFAIPWITVAIRHVQRRAKQPIRQTSSTAPSSQPIGYGGYGPAHTKAKPTAQGNRNLWIGLGVGGGVCALLLVLGIAFIVSAVKKQARRAEVRKMMQDPEWREKHLGEKQGWQTYTDASPLYGFSVELPNPPIKQHQGFAAGGTQWIVMAHRDKETYSVVTIRPALGVDSQQAEQLLRSADQVAVGMQARVTSQRPVTVGGVAGTEFVYESLADKKSFNGRIRLFATSNMIFQVGWMVSPRAPLTSDVTRFLDSFQLPESVELPKPPTRLEMNYTPPPQLEFKVRSFEELTGESPQTDPTTQP